MPQNGLIGTGVKVGYAAASPHVWKKLEQVEDVTPPKFTADKIDSTFHGSGRFKKTIPGLFAVSDMVVKMLRDADPATSPIQNTLWDLMIAQTDLWWRLEIPATSNIVSGNFEAYEFMGRVSDITPVAPVAGKQEYSCNVMFDGDSLVHYFPMASQLG